MKVRIKDLLPNPYRNLPHYPIDQAKVATLVASIEQTDFWDNILGRKKGDKVEIAYGHHRLAALRKARKPDDQVDIPVKALDDATMIRIMANENMEDWKTSPAVIDETVRTARDFLNKHPEEVKKVWKDEKRIPTERGIGARIIGRFLGWPESRESLLNAALERIVLVDNGTIEPETLRTLPTEGTARQFTKAVRQFKPTHAQQKRAAAQIAGAARGERGDAAVRSAVTEQIYARPKPEHRDLKRIELREEVKAANKLARDLSAKLGTMTRFREVLKDQIYRDEIADLAIEFNVLIQALKTFIGGGKIVKQLEK